MQKTLKSWAMVAAAAALALGVAACSSAPSSSSESSAPAGDSSSASASDTVAVDVGNGTPVQMTKSRPKIGVIMTGLSNQWMQNFAASAKAAGEAAGADVTIFDPKFDAATQLNMITQAITTHSQDALIVETIDGNQICDAVSKQAPAANIPVVIVAGQVCNLQDKVGAEGWAPGTLTFVGGDSTMPFQLNWVRQAVKMNPGKKLNVLAALGPEVVPFTKTEKTAIAQVEKEEPNLHIVDYLYTDWTTPTAYKMTLDYMKAHGDQINFILSCYSPDETRGIINALTSLGLDGGKVPIGDMGGSTYSVQQIKAGNIQYSLPYVPVTQAQKSIQAIMDAQAGKTVDRYIPEWATGTAEDPFIITKDNVDTFKAEF